MNYERIIRLSLALVIAATTITASAVLVSAQEATKPEAPVNRQRRAAAIHSRNTSPPVKPLRQQQNSRRRRFKFASSVIARRNWRPRPLMCRRQSRPRRC